MDKRLGVLGGGQLGRMLIADASRMGLAISVLDPALNAPAKQIANHRGHKEGAYTDLQAVIDFAKDLDVLTVEIEHVNVEALRQVERTQTQVWPSAEVVGVIQDKFAQHRHLQARGVAVAAFSPIDGTDLEAEIRTHVEAFGLPLMIKSRTQAYDGRGNFLLRELRQLGAAIEALGAGKRPLYVERIVPFVCEVAVMVVRAQDGQMRSYPAVETIHRDNVCHIVFAPLRVGDVKTPTAAQALAERAVEALGKGAVGVFGVEMFLLEDGSLLVNEVAPRPHNSGHYTIEACATSQYENHMRAVLGLPLGSTEIIVPFAAMLNILGASDDLRDLDALRSAALATEGASLHWYGKDGSRAGRKLGHITLVGKDASLLDKRLSSLLKALPSAMQDTDGPRALYTASGPRIGIIMGSDSDLRVMRKAAEVLEHFGIEFEVKIVSAHRTPHLMVDYASSSIPRGLSVIIAGAGGAAHLPGMVAALTTLPVIGVPVKSSSLDGVDSLHSIVQMPRGVPVATVAIDNATNAALLALRILATSDFTVAQALADYAEQMSREVKIKRQHLDEDGWKTYSAS